MRSIHASRVSSALLTKFLRTSSARQQLIITKIKNVVRGQSPELLIKKQFFFKYFIAQRREWHLSNFTPKKVLPRQKAKISAKACFPFFKKNYFISFKRKNASNSLSSSQTEVQRIDWITSGEKMVRIGRGNIGIFHPLSYFFVKSYLNAVFCITGALFSLATGVLIPLLPPGPHVSEDYYKQKLALS